MNTIATSLNFSILVVFYVSYCYPRWHTSKEQLFLKTVCYIYFIGVAYVTLMPWFFPIPFLTLDASMTTVNLVPFFDISQGHGGAWKELFLNIIMMIPFGILVPLAYHKGGKETVLLAMLTSICIETLQFFSVGITHACDLTDVISNTIGGGIGFLLCTITKRPALRLIHCFFPPIAYDKPPKLYITMLCTKIILSILLFLLLLVSIYHPFLWLQ